MRNSLAFFGGIFTGAVGMYYLDPRHGAYRRALARDKSVHYGKLLRKRTEVVSRDLLHRSQGILAEARTRLTPQRAPDDILVARVASKIGRVISNPHAIQLTSENSKIFVSGPIYTDEIENLLHTIRSVPGVRGVESHLESHSRGENFPGLQGHAHLKGEKIDILQEKWSPATRFLLSLAGSMLAVSAGALMSKNKAA